MRQASKDRCPCLVTTVAEEGVVIVKITSGWLKKRYACAGGIRTFAAEWPDGAEVTAQNLDRACELGLSIKWLLDKIGTQQAMDDYHQVGNVVFEDYQRNGSPTLDEERRIEKVATIAAILASVKSRRWLSLFRRV